MEQSIGDKKNGIVLRYDCILDGIFELRGKKYGIVSETAYICPVPEKGKYLGEVNGVKCYEFKGKADAILVDRESVCCGAYRIKEHNKKRAA